MRAMPAPRCRSYRCSSRSVRSVAWKYSTVKPSGSSTRTASPLPRTAAGGRRSTRHPRSPYQSLTRSRSSGAHTRNAMHLHLLLDQDEPDIEDFKALMREPHILPVPLVESIDVSNAVLYLACDESRYVTGVALPIDAGLLTK